MINKGLFISLFLADLKKRVVLNDAARGRLATLAHRWQSRDAGEAQALWESFLKQAVAYLEFVPPVQPESPGVYPLYEDWGRNECIAVLYLAPPGSDIDDTAVGRFYPAKLLAQLKARQLNWGMLTDGARWRLYSTKSARPYEDYVELDLAATLAGADEAEYGLFERFFHKDSFVADQSLDSPPEAGDTEDGEEMGHDERAPMPKCRLDGDREQSERTLEERVKKPFLAQVDEVLQYICNGFIFDTRKTGAEYTEEERAEIFESAVKLIYRCLFLFYAEARRLLPTDPEKAELYGRHSIRALCLEAHKFRWGKRRDDEQYDIWKHLKGLISAVNDGDPEYGIMGYDGGLFDDEAEPFLGRHQLRNDFLSRALYLLAFVEPLDDASDAEYPMPYEDLEVRHLGELYETILEYTVLLADADRLRRRTKKGIEILLASQTARKAGDTLIKKGDVYFGESALERKQTGSYYTPESLVRFLNQKTIVQPLAEIFERQYGQRFNALLDQVSKGNDVGTRRGAAQATAVLVGRFAEEEVFRFKVCDPAMGSGHFLVDAANQMTGLVIALLAEVPYVDGLTVSLSSAPNDWRRQITRHSLYGVDRNPLAVNLAKLSLWLNSFATPHKLTFLDHHLCCGNSLIGIRSIDQLATVPRRKRENATDKEEGAWLFDLDDLSGALTMAAQGMASITQVDEDDTDRQKVLFDEARETTSRLGPLAGLYTAYLMNPAISPGNYRGIFEWLAAGKSLAQTKNPVWRDILMSVEAARDGHGFFHWPVEFPDVFGAAAAGGFSATVGNPPWDVLQPNAQEFYIDYDPGFRKYNKQEALRAIDQLHKTHPTVAARWETYETGFKEASTYFKEPAAYSCLQVGKIDLYKAFLERFYSILRRDGRMGILVPSGIYTDQGCQPLRELFLTRCQTEFVYCFENRSAVFNIHRSFKFVLFGTQKGGSTNQFKCAFMEQDPERLSAIDTNALRMSVAQVKKFSPDILGVMEFKSQRDIEIAATIHGSLPQLGHSIQDGWNVKLTMGDFNLTSDSHILRRLHDSDLNKISSIGDLMNDCANNSLSLVYEGKNCWFYDSSVTLPQLVVHKRSTKSISFQLPRVGFRRIAASTNERTLVPCVIPANTLCTYGIVFVDDNCEVPIGISERIFLHSVWASFLMDFLMRFQVTTSISNRNGYTLPVFRNEKSSHVAAVVKSILPRAIRLICGEGAFQDLWQQAFCTQWQLPDFWYPSSAPIDAYGPAHEREIRRGLRDEAERLTPEWGPHCGVHDRTADRRDAGDRAQLRAEIDAYVAHLYGLSRDDFAYILDTFPVLKRKEEKAFGEFMSKRKCLEEYDRLAAVLEKQR